MRCGSRRFGRRLGRGFGRWLAGWRRLRDGILLTLGLVTLDLVTLGLVTLGLHAALLLDDIITNFEPRFASFKKAEAEAVVSGFIDRLLEKVDIAGNILCEASALNDGEGAAEDDGRDDQNARGNDEQHCGCGTRQSPAAGGS